ncbi:inner nuclear membrane protein Man1 [Musca vetustissima]|uniref:inner nuclear membrane protein Man1 n=1 Tax=Musca vetustissima TaxID=27455 RepID=UPI002AB7381A|nr:inner nuclear membrane protein Man1 [Musca vetustissima]
MNEAYFDNLSDVELRQELKKYGIPVVPIVETTRNLLIKKLKYHALNNANSSTGRSNRRSLQTMPSTTTASSSTKRNVSPGRRRTHHSFARPSSNASDTLSNMSYTNGGTTSSEFRTDQIEQKHSYLSNEGMSYIYRDYGKSSDERNKPPQTKSSSPKIYVPPPILANDVQRPIKRLESSNMREINRTPPYSGNSESSGVVSRLLKLRDISLRGGTHNATPSYAAKNHFSYSTDSDSDSGSPTRYTLTKRKQTRSVRDVIWSKLNIKGKLKQSSVPYVLMCCLGLFFVVLSILYMTKPPDMPSTMLEKSTSFVLCDEHREGLSLARPSIDCITHDLIAPSLTLCKELIQLLQHNTEVHYCQNKELSPEVTVSDFLKHLYRKRSSDSHKLLKSLKAALYLIEQNPQWKIQVFNRSEDPDVIDIYRDVHFSLLKPYLPLKCILMNKLQRFLFIIGTTFLIAVVCAAIFVIWRLLRQRSERKIKTVENFCKEIIKELMHRRSLKNDSGEVIIHHLRDKLIPLNKRKSLLGAWNEAIHKLECNDSRIQFGTILHNGEEFRTMKWCESVCPSPSSSFLSSTTYEKPDTGKPQKKQWQSPAFDNVNKILDPPTNCLKVRHMFDETSQPDLQSVIESILEKVGPQCKIYDIQLDRQNCCVYIRCATEKDAGIVHNEINGWWFDNRLVSIKFLRLPRFLARFPNSTSTTPLTIRNNTS